jgi:CRP-like cAMP-binding protein
LALAAISESYKAGHVIIREGDPGDIFYMIESGSVDVYIKALGDAPIATLSNGEFFGEMALLSNEPRAASCIAKTDVKCHILMRNDFILLLGDLELLMKTNYRKRSSLGDEPMEELEVVKPKLE